MDGANEPSLLHPDFALDIFIILLAVVWPTAGWSRISVSADIRHEQQLGSGHAISDCHCRRSGRCHGQGWDKIVLFNIHCNTFGHLWFLSHHSIGRGAILGINCCRYYTSPMSPIHTGKYTRSLLWYKNESLRNGQHRNIYLSIF